MKISIAVEILPRLETFFLEEWIQHHLSLGVDKIYIYNFGPKAVSPLPREQAEIDPGVVVGKGDKVGRWVKKPNCDYFEEYSYEEILSVLEEICSRYNEVELIPWVYGKNHNLKHPHSQREAYKRSIETYESDWWLFIDPDEYIILFEHDSLKKFINDRPREEITNFLIQQRVFDERTCGKPVREIYNYGYDVSLTKSLVISDYKEIHLHKTSPNRGETVEANRDVIRFNHYRGHPRKHGGGKIRKGFCNIKMDKFDDSMRRFTDQSHNN